MRKFFILAALLIPLFTVFASYDIQQYSPGVAYKAIFLADMNGDGTIEVIAGNGLSHQIEIWDYDSLTDSLVLIDSITGVSNDAHDIGVADIEDDGDMDIVSTHRNDGLYFSRNDGGSWSTTHLDGTYGWRTFLADFDGDGNYDIFDGTDYYYIKIFYGDGSGNFLQGPAPQLEYFEGHGKGFNAIDINSDLRLDLVGIASVMDRSFLRVYLNIDTLASDTIEWTSSVGPDDSLAYSPKVLSSSSNSAADLDGNGYIDQVAFYRNGELVIFRGNASGDSLYWVQDTLDTSADTLRTASLYDINEDGELDILAGGRENFNGFKVYYGDGAGNFSADSIPLDHGVTNARGRALKAGDINNDGLTDIVTSRYTSDFDGFEVLYRKGEGDVAATSILAPGSFVEPGDSISPVAVYENLGTDTATFEAGINIDSAGSWLYGAHGTLTLAPGAADTLSPPPFTQIGDHGVVYDIEAYTKMQFDVNSSNDTISGKTSVFEVQDELLSSWDGSPPTVDGVIDTTAGEWDSSFVYDISDVAGNLDRSPNLPGECYLYILNDSSNLYCGIDFVSDTTLDDPTPGGGAADMVVEFFDENNDDVWDTDSTEGQYRFAWIEGCDTIVYSALPDSLYTEFGSPSSILFARTLDDHQQYEFSIPFGDDKTLKHYLNNSGLPDTMGMLIAAMNAHDTSTALGGVWPTEVEVDMGRENPEPTVFGNVILAGKPESGIKDNPDAPSEYSIKLLNSVSYSGNLEVRLGIPGETERLEISLYDLSGRAREKIVKKSVKPGVFNAKIKGNLTAGVYFVEMTAGEFRDVQKAVVLK